MVENPQSASGSTPAHSERIDGAEGIVKWFDPRKGFGFLVGPDGQDIFVHFQVIQGEGFRVLKDGSSVLYDALKTDKGWKATRVSRGAELNDIKVFVKKPHLRTPRR
jgi:CspA family cold shock protein